MACQAPWVIQHQNYLCRKTVLALFNPLVGGHPVGWGSRISWLYLCKGVRPLTTITIKCSEYNTKPSDVEGPVRELMARWSTPLLPLLLGPLWPRVMVGWLGFVANMMIRNLNQILKTVMTYLIVVIKELVFVWCAQL